MRRATRISLTVAAVVVATAIAVAVAAPRLIDPERYRGLLEERAASAVGREVRLGAILLGEPSAVIDWEAAARSYAERQLGREVERQVGKILGRLLGDDPTPRPR